MLEMLKELHSPVLSQAILGKVITLAEAFQTKYGRKPVFMEVCGSHTMALARTGLKKRLQEYVHLVSGPGCPVCVTDQKSIDSMIALADGENRIICTFGDMIRVPGSRKTLMDAKTEGKDVRVVYSPTDAIGIAMRHPDREVVFLGIGFETTIPILAIVLKEAQDKKLTNFSMWVTTKLIEPILRHLLDGGEVKVDGFLLPGHVSMVLGAESYRYLTEEYGISGVISGFEPVQMASGIYRLLELSFKEESAIINDLASIVGNKGNAVAQSYMETYFVKCDEEWRGIGRIANSGLAIREEYRHLDAKAKFAVPATEVRVTKCRCGEVIRGLISPPECRLFGVACTPVQPVGPCMVSTEGTCAAYYAYTMED
ncbi:hydrogenase formation protein HypD [Paenibacillus sp. LMG 31456]|uniref:Hydrogenase formation protein HypD n=1 Tax=Paenibacillus foliorum TaxID=2654974 RepID=A0A972GM35_9BACL|nr:hydrogenase formation protein HypD [Paenibacillus foliorum]NOU93244.1 hydrogenase formation protein HypD [Paenibacillus foliorum]